MASERTNPSGSRVALAHRRADVRAINADIRSALKASGRLPRAQQDAAPAAPELVYDTNDGKRAFAAGDRIVLLENNRDLGVKNGMLGTVEAVGPDAIQVRLDGAGPQVRKVAIPVKSYQAFDHGYATTIHKSQGATVDRAFVMASSTMDRHLTYVAMTRHRENIRLYVDQGAFKDVATLALGIGRSGVKETTLDYKTTFAERRGIAEKFGLRSEIEIGIRSGQSEARAKQRHSADEERVLAPAAVRTSAPRDVGNEPLTQSIGERLEQVTPLVPAVTKHERSIEDIAREKARPQFARAMETVRSMSRLVFKDHEAVAARIEMRITDESADPKMLASRIAEHPEAFGALLGKTGLFGDNKQRQAAQRLAKSLGHYIGSAAETWQRRLAAENESEIWNREKRDVVEVPGLTPQSERILSQLDKLPYRDKPVFIAQLRQTPEGQQALKEAATIVTALERRFGTPDLGRKDAAIERLGPEVKANLDRVKSVAKIVERAHLAELSHRQELKRLMTKGLGLGL